MTQQDMRALVDELNQASVLYYTRGDSPMSDAQWDALYDLLTAYPAARLTLRHPEMLVAHLGNYGELVLRVLADAAAENPAFTLNVQ